MASQLQFEGPVLDDLLERVRAEVGSGARIVAANRIRKGGIGGFFAREAYEVLVEAADPAAPAESPTPGSPRRIATETATLEPRAPATILELADAVSENERNDVIDLVEERSVSTESRDFARVLNRVSQSIDATPDELGSDIDIRESGRPSSSRPSSSRPVTDQPTAAPPAPAAPPVPPSVPLATEPGEPAPRPLDDDLTARTRRAAQLPPSERRAATPAEVIDRYETRISRLGLPARLIPRGVGQHELKGALVESLTRLPPAPSIPAAFGVVIAVAGIGPAPVLLARELAAELALDPDDVVLATREQLGFGIPAWLQMSDGATAQERRRSWGRRTRPTIVACSLPSASGLRWARDMLDNLEPTVTWAIVDAGWKREDIAHRIDALGGVDAIALDGLDGTVSPATVLELGIPVGRLEREHASPLTWTELLLERLSS